VASSIDRNASVAARQAVSADRAWLFRASSTIVPRFARASACRGIATAMHAAIIRAFLLLARHAVEACRAHALESGDKLGSASHADATVNTQRRALGRVANADVTTLAAILATKALVASAKAHLTGTTTIAVVCADTLDVTSTSVEAIVARALARHNVLLAIDTWVLAIVLNRTSVALQVIAGIM